MPAMAQNAQTPPPNPLASQNSWKLESPPDTEVRVDQDVLALRAPLVQVHRDDEGVWIFDGPGAVPRPAHTTALGNVVGAWPHVAGLSGLDAGGSAVWSWQRHGWTTDSDCDCGSCVQPAPTDLSRDIWPPDLHPHHLVSVERTALTGQVELVDILATPGGTVLLGPGSHRRTSELMTPVAMANVLRRWPHTMQALRSLHEGRGMRWNTEDLNWHEYVIA